MHRIVNHRMTPNALTITGITSSCTFHSRIMSRLRSWYLSIFSLSLEEMFLSSCSAMSITKTFLLLLSIGGQCQVVVLYLTSSVSVTVWGWWLQCVLCNVTCVLLLYIQRTCFYGLFWLLRYALLSTCTLLRQAISRRATVSSATLHFNMWGRCWPSLWMLCNLVLRAWSWVAVSNATVWIFR